MRRSGRAVVGAAIATMMIGALSACSMLTGDDADDSKGKGGQKSDKGSHAASSSGKKIGDKGTACPLPVTFDLAKGWKPKATTPATAEDTKDKELAEALNGLLDQGEVHMVCEIDAKPAGNIGFLRVWTGEKTAGGGDARKVLEGFLAGGGDKASGEKYRAVTVGGMKATEVTYTTYNKLMEESKKERALAVMTAKGAVLLHLGGLDSEEHEEMLPAFELAKQTLAPSGA